MSYEPSTYWARRNRPVYKSAQGKDIEFCEKHLKSARRVLDFGCGDGRMIKCYRHAHVNAYDITNIVRNKYEKKARFNKLNYHYDLGKYGERLPYGDHLFDACLCMEVLLHEPDPKWIMGELARVAKRVVVISFYDKNPRELAPHCFNHDYFELLKGFTTHDLHVTKDRIRFVYGYGYAGNASR